MRASRSPYVSDVLIALAALLVVGFNDIAEALGHVANAPTLHIVMTAFFASHRAQPASGLTADTNAEEGHLPAIDTSCAGCHLASHLAPPPRFRSMWYATMLPPLYRCDARATTAHCVERAQCRPR